MRRVLALNALAALALGALAPLAVSAPPAAASPDSALRTSLARSIASAGRSSGAMVVELGSGRTLFSRRPDAYRVPASNEKLYTSSVALMRFGPSGRLTTRVLGEGTLDVDGTYTGNLYLRGGGDPTFGTASFVRRAWGTGATVSDLADQLAALGILRVRGAVLGDGTNKFIGGNGTAHVRLRAKSANGKEHETSNNGRET